MAHHPELHDELVHKFLCESLVDEAALQVAVNIYVEE